MARGINRGNYMRKPKYHPKYKTKLVGINFRERWNVVQHATKNEIESYIENFRHIQKSKKENLLHGDWWSKKQSIINETTQNNFLRKLWRKRHSETFQQDVLYRVDRNIARWNQKLGPKMGDGLATSYHFDRHRTQTLSFNDLVVLTKVDEMGNLYFSKANAIDAPHPYVFNRDNAQLGWILPVET